MVLGLLAADAGAQDKHAAMVVDANNGNAMHADRADEPRYPASLTKIMTLYLAFEAIEQGRASYATRIKVSHEAASQPPTKLDLEPGETIALIDAMKALITKSANDAAVAIAEHFGGTEARFARMMTDKARLFGMSRTTFRNASGLPDPGQVTTASDMVRLALRLQDDFPKHYHLFALRSFSYDGSTYRNHNNLLFRFQGTDGIKTGYTRASGFNLVSSVRRGGRHVIGVVMGGRTASRRDDAMQLLLSRALINASPYKTRRSTPVLVAAATPAVRPRPVQQAEPVAVPPERPRQPAWAEADATRPRPVMVPPRSRAETPLADTGNQWPATVPSPMPATRPQPVRAPAQAEEPASRYQFAPRGYDPAPPRAPVPPHPIPLEPMRGAAPSTFQQQATNLARGSEALTPPAPRPATSPYAVRGPMAGEGLAAPAGGGFEIQIGAFATALEADRALAGVRANAGELLHGSAARTLPVAKDNRQVYRARFAGFDSRTAASTCLELRRRQIDCFVIRAE